MSHVPDPSHDRHDLELIAAHAAGDLADTGLADAERLLATCTACAELHADLRAIAAAIPAIPPRRRTRDYRITPEQADALRPRGWRRILAAFGSPRLAFTAPLGTGLAALGIAGLLVAALPGAALPLAAVDDAAKLAIETALPESNTGGGSAGQGGQQGQGGIDAGFGSTSSGAPEGQPGVPTQGSGPEAPGGAGQPDTGDRDQVAAERLAAGEEARIREADQVLVLLAGLALLAGAGMLGLRWSSRRTS